MADLLSVTASIIAVAGAADAVTKGLRRLKAAKGAPKGLQDLFEDVEQLELVLGCVKSAVLSPGSPPIGLATLVEEAGSKLLELRSLIEYTLTEAGISDKIDRWQWLRKESEVERLRNQLGTIRLNLVAVTSSANSGILQRISLNTQDLSSEQQRLNAQMTSVLPRQEAILSHFCQGIEEIHATQAAMMRFLGNFRHIDANMASDNAAALSEKPETAAITPVVARPRMRSRREFHIQNSPVQSACPLACPCSCHETWRIYSPWKLRKLFGNSKIESAGNPFFKGACSLRLCKGKWATSIHINFFLPTMIAARMISLWFTSSPLYGPELLLRVARVLREDASVIWAIRSRDLDAVKRSISAGDCKPWDVDYRGTSLICKALKYRNFSTALYLAQMASDDYECLREDFRFGLLDMRDQLSGYLWDITDSISRTAVSRLIFGLRLERGVYPALDIDIAHGVDWNELCAMNGFSKLHKIVYGITSQPLEAEIEARPEDLDRPDSIGLTPLWYACWLGNSNHIRFLIHHGADVNNARIPPICAAVSSGSYDSVEQLLNAGALVPDRLLDDFYYTLMHRLNRPGDHVEDILAIDKALFGRCLNINHRPSIYGAAPPLISLARQRLPYSYARMRQLFEFGADVELCDNLGLTPLYTAIWTSNAEGCRTLGRLGAYANVQTYIGTILHAAIKNAIHADIIKAVSELDLSGVELGARESSGRTIFELFKLRAGRHRNHGWIFPGVFRYKLFFGISVFILHSIIGSVEEHYVKDVDTELQILLSFQSLLQQVQEAQGIPIEDRYPLLNLTRECVMVNLDEDEFLEPVTPSMPGAWPQE